MTSSGAGALIVLQARMGSTRCPGKVLASIDGATVLAHCIRRLEASGVGPVVVATTGLAADDVTAREAGACGAAVVRGPTDDVLERFLLATVGWSGEWVIRATADNPAVDHQSAGRVLECLRGGADYVVESGLPVGAAVEGVRTSALRIAAREAQDAYDREHVTPWLASRGERFVVRRPDAPSALRRPEIRLTIDTPADLAFMTRLLGRTGGGQRIVPLAEIICAADDLQIRGTT